MSDVNNVVLIGRLVRDADLKYTPSGTAVSKFTLAVNKKRKDGDKWKDEAGFFEIVFWGKLGETLNPYLKKGKQIAVAGELTQERWDQNGENRSKVVVTAAMIQLLSGTSGPGGGSEPEHGATPASADDGFTDDVPF